MQIGEFILPDIRQYTERYALKLPFDVTKIDLCQLGTDAIAMGAATLVLRAVFCHCWMAKSRAIPNEGSRLGEVQE